MHILDRLAFRNGLYSRFSIDAMVSSFHGLRITMTSPVENRNTDATFVEIMKSTAFWASRKDPNQESTRRHGFGEIRRISIGGYVARVQAEGNKLRQ